MRQALLVIVIFLFIPSLYSQQYYLRGEVRDENGKLLPNVKINLFSEGNYTYTSGSAGVFGIPSFLSVDTITLVLEGYEVLRKPVVTSEYQVLQMKVRPLSASVYNYKLASRTRDFTSERGSLFAPINESYISTIENVFVDADKNAETGFSLNINRASYSNIRRFINNQLYVPTDAVRIDELLNYFDFRKVSDNSVSKDFTFTTAVTSCPWNNNNQLFFITIDAPKLNLDSIPSSNLVFLIDVSGSMEQPTRLPLLKSAFKLLVDHLRCQDTISIVTYGGGIQVELEPTSGADKEKIKNVIDSLDAAGDTPGAGAITAAYSLARKTFIKNGNNRVILATDGDFNVGQTSDKDLEDIITAYRQTGIYLTCLGVGMGNYKDSKLESLAKKGNGNFAYLDNLQEAEKVLITEFTKTLYTVANDAYVSVSFNPSMVKQYRLIGYDNKRDAILENSWELEGGEIGSGHSILSVFEITPEKDAHYGYDIFAKVGLQYKLPKKDSTIIQKYNVPYLYNSIDSVDTSYRFATAVIMFGSLLKESKFAHNYTLSDVEEYAMKCCKKNSIIQQEFLSLVQKANKIYNPQRFKRKKKLFKGK